MIGIAINNTGFDTQYPRDHTITKQQSHLALWSTWFCLPTTNQPTNMCYGYCGDVMSALAAEPRLRAIRSPSAGGEVNDSDNYLSGAEFYTKKPIRKSLRGPSLVYANVLALLKPRRDKQESPRRHEFGCKRNVPFNCMLHLHMHHFAGRANDPETRSSPPQTNNPARQCAAMQISLR